MIFDFEWIDSDMNLYQMSKNNPHTITVKNSGDLEIDFYIYSKNFYIAAINVIQYLINEAGRNEDIAKLDFWYFSMIYLYRQSLELLLKACIFQQITDNADRKVIVGNIRHDLKQAYEKLIEVRDLTIYDNENKQWLMNYLNDISRIDRDSDMFRYPFGNNLKILFEDEKHISLVATHKNMNKAFRILREIYNTGDASMQKIKAYEPLLIIEGGYHYQQSVVGYELYQHNFTPYYKSYAEVGTFLKDNIINKNKCNLFLPMCYLYRNAVELALKRLIMEDSYMDQSKALRIVRKKKHSILGLWNSILDEIKEYTNTPEEEKTLYHSQQYIKTFHDFDPKSDLFRYPCDKNMEPYFLESQKFDVKNIASCFEGLCNVLEGIEGKMSDI